MLGNYAFPHTCTTMQMLPDELPEVMAGVAVVCSGIAAASGLAVSSDSMAPPVAGCRLWAESLEVLCDD
jgi:hypothetical protein